MSTCTPLYTFFAELFDKFLGSLPKHENAWTCLPVSGTLFCQNGEPVAELHLFLVYTISLGVGI